MTEEKTVKVEVGTKLVWKYSTRSGLIDAKVVEVEKINKDHSFNVSGLPKGKNRFGGKGWATSEPTVTSYGKSGHGKTDGTVYPWSGETDEQLTAEVEAIKAQHKEAQDKKNAEREAAYNKQLNEAKAANEGCLEIQPLVDDLMTMKLVNHRGEEVRLIFSTKLVKDWDWHTGEEYDVIEANITSRGGGHSDSWASWSSEKVRTMDELVDRIAYRVWY